MNTLLIAATAGLVMIGIQAKADHSLLSPRAKELFGHKTVAVSGPQSGGAVMPLGPAAKAPTTRESMAVSASASEPNLVVRHQGYTGRNPFGTQRDFEIAPVGKGKECAADCTKDCCVKK